MDESFKNRINKIQEIYPKTFQIILDFASNRILDYVLSSEYKYLWIHNFTPIENLSWNDYEMPISKRLQKKVLTRNLRYDFIIETKEFEDVKNEISNGITLVQINKLPSFYLDLQKIKGKTRYELLKRECDYLFEIDLPAAVDYGTLTSWNDKFLNELLNDSEIDWTHLP